LGLRALLILGEESPTIAYQVWSPASETSRIYVMSADGSQQTRISDGPSWDSDASFPDPDGSLVPPGKE